MTPGYQPVAHISGKTEELHSYIEYGPGSSLQPQMYSRTVHRRRSETRENAIFVVGLWLLDMMKMAEIPPERAIAADRYVLQCVLERCSNWNIIHM